MHANSAIGGHAPFCTGGIALDLQRTDAGFPSAVIRKAQHLSALRFKRDSRVPIRFTARAIDPFNRALSVNAPAMMWNPQMPFGLASLDGVISRAALQIAYANDFLFLFYTSIPAVLLVWLMRRPQLPGASPPKREDLHLSE